MRVIVERLIIALVAMSSVTPCALGQRTETEGPPDQTVTIDDFKWIAGHWQGSAMGGDFEETWNPPFAGTMVGMFKFAQRGAVQFYEILTIVSDGDSYVLRLKHFDQKLAGWEEKDESVEFPLVRVSEKEAVFEGLRFERIDEDTMHIVVRIGKDDDMQEETFVCQRVGEP